MIPGRRWFRSLQQACVAFPQSAATTRRGSAADDSAGRIGTSRTNGAGHSVGLAAVGVLLVLIGASLPAPSDAQSSASYQIPRQAIAAGAGPASSASYSIDGTIGQPGAAAAGISASYAQSGGFHRTTAAPLSDALFANGFEAP